jgi:hypothetical protein
MDIRRSIIFLAFILLVSHISVAQTGITGITFNIEGSLMYYTAEKSGEYALYKAIKQENGTWSAGEPDNSFNEHIKGYIVKTPFLAYDGQTLYFSSNLQGSKGFDIYFCKKTGDLWSKPVIFSAVINTDADEMSPSLSADNQTIYFTRKDPATDCFDVYVSETDASGWSVPKMLPVPINVGCENYVHISPTGETLLFSTDRLSDKKKKKYNVFYSILINKNMWSPPFPAENISKEYNELSPAVDYKSNKIFVAKAGIDSANYRIHSYDILLQAVSKPFTILTGIIKNGEGKPVSADIVIRNSYTNDIYGKSNSNPETGEYTVVLPNDGLYNINYSIKYSAQRFENVNTANNVRAQIIRKDIILIDKLLVNVTVQDALSNKFIDAEVQAYEKTKSAKVSKIEQGKYRIVAPVFENLDIELYRQNYVKENIIVNVSDYVEFTELNYTVKFKPELRSGEINVKDISSNTGLTAAVEVRNLDIKDDRVIVSSEEAGNYQFNIRKDCKYSISITLKDYLYYYTVWKADAGRIGQVLDVRPVPLKEMSKIPMPNLTFDEGSSILQPEASGELSCVIDVLKNNPDYTAVISLYQLNNEMGLVMTQQRARSIITFMDANRIPKSRYKVEIIVVEQIKLPDINFVLNIPTGKK